MTELEKAAEAYANERWPYPPMVNYPCNTWSRDAFIAGAEWMRERILSELKAMNWNITAAFIKKIGTGPTERSEVKGDE